MNRSHEYAALLMQKARDDAYVLNRLIDDPEAPAWGLGFHAQQAAEKAIKAVLTSRSVEYPRTHNLSMLVDLLRQAGTEPPPDAKQLPRLTPFGVLLRYDEEPERGAMGTLPERHWLRDCVERTLEWAHSAIAQAGQSK